ncbi:hypothetical protein CLAIMM_04190 [Cladophialophora immunda]|nr:hypothetical protein CLAIMM_04190 [Cladophialophora immunda]
MASSHKQSYGSSSGSHSIGSSTTITSRTSTFSSSSSGATAGTTFSSVLKQNPQIVSDRYIKSDKLTQYLEATYGSGQCAVHHKSGNFYIIAPDELSDDVLKSCE